MKVSCIYKDVTYDTLTSGGFIEAITEHFPGLVHVTEHSAIQERKDARQGKLDIL